MSAASARAWYRHRRVQIGFALRVAVAAVLSLAIAQYLELRLPLWAVLTALIVTQLSVGKSIRSTLDYMLGTIGGAVYGGAIASLIPHDSEWALLLVLAVSVLPLAYIAAINPKLSAAPVTNIIVLLVPQITHSTPLASAVDRVLEVAVGALTGLAVSYLLLPSKAHGQAIELAATTLERLAGATGTIIGRLPTGVDIEELHRLQDGIGHSLDRLNAISAEAENERAARLISEPALGPLTRTLLRIRHDVVMIGRAAQTPLPEALQDALRSVLSALRTDAAAYLSACADDLRLRRSPPAPERVEAAFESFLHEVTSIREQGLTRGLTANVTEQFFALGFALEQLRGNLRDLNDCVTELAEKPKGRSAATRA